MIKIILATIIFISCSFVHCSSADSDDFEPLPPQRSLSKPPIARSLKLALPANDPFASDPESPVQSTPLLTLAPESPLKRKPVILKCISPHTHLVFGVTAYENDSTTMESIMVDAFITEYFCGLLKFMNADVCCVSGISYVRILDERVHNMLKEKYEEWLNQGLHLKAELLKWDYMRFFGVENLKKSAWKAF